MLGPQPKPMRKVYVSCESDVPELLCPIPQQFKLHGLGAHAMHASQLTNAPKPGTSITAVIMKSKE